MRRAVAPALAAALLLLATAAAAAPRVRVVVLPVVVHSTDDTAYLQRGIADMLGTRLEQNPALAVVRVQNPAAATVDPAAARKAAQAAGADYALFGSFTQFGDGASLDLHCVSTRGAPDADPRSIFVQAGTVGEIIPRLGDVADRVARYVTGTGDAAPAVAAGPGVRTAAPARSEFEELRARVERLESLLGARPAAAPARPPVPAAPVAPPAPRP
jgi:TolB-like protein